jgi:hypothetical protein
MLRVPHCLDSRLTNGGVFGSITYQSRCNIETLFISVSATFLLEAEYIRRPSETGMTPSPRNLPPCSTNTNQTTMRSVLLGQNTDS